MKLKKILFKIYERMANKEYSKNIYKEISGFKDLDTNEKENIREKKLLNILMRAYHEVPYYHQLFDEHNLSFSSPASLSDFSRIPILNKEKIKKNFKDIQNRHIEDLHPIINRTSGSTGSPLVFIIDRETSHIKKALQDYQLSENGRTNNDILIKFWGSVEENLKFLNKFKKNITNWFRDQIELNTLILDEEKIQSIIRKLSKYHSIYIEAYAQTIYEIAKYINKNKISIHNVKAITSTVSVLFDFMRDEIEMAFNCPVFNRYGSREASMIAFERVPKGGLEISTSQYIVEVLKDNGEPCLPGEEGDIVITNFSNFAFPFIRYQIGDRAVVKAVEDKPVRSCTAFDTLTGRITSSFLKENGTRVNSSYFAILLRNSLNSNWIEKMQIIQLDYKKIEIDIVKAENSTPPEKSLDFIIAEIKAVMGADCDVNFNFVDKIDLPGSGKYQYIRTLIKSG